MLHTGHLLGRPKNSLFQGASLSEARRNGGHVSPSSPMELFSSLDMGVSNAVTLGLFVSSPPLTHPGKEGFPPFLCALVGKR